MKKEIHLSSRSEARRGNARSIICHRGGVWPRLLLAGWCAVLTGLAHPARAAVTEAWVQRYNGLANDRDVGTAVAVDGSGNVVVTGSSCNGTNHDYYTAKHAAADGALLWEKRYNGPANGEAFVAARPGLALGPNGMVAITGTSSDAYATVVYRENLPPVSIARISTGICLRFTGVPGRSYNIERAPPVAGPWTTLATPTAPLGGLIEYVDTNPPVGTVSYRTSAL